MARGVAFGPGLVLGLSLAAMAVVGLVRAQMPLLMLFYSAAFGAMLWALHRHKAALEQPRVLLGWALAFRAILLPTWPDLSDDLFRYIWDGWLLSDGLNPYAMRPSDPALAAYSADPLFMRLNSPDYYSVYPPVSQLFFLAGGAVYPLVGWKVSALFIKLCLVCAEVAGLVLLVRARLHSKMPLAPLVLYAWNPLVLVVFAGQGHSEAAMMLGMALAIWGLYVQRPVWSWLGYLTAGLVKLTPLALGPLWLRHSRGRGMCPAVVVGAALVLPLAVTGVLENIWSSIQLYVGLFEFNAGLYYGLKYALYWITGENLSGELGVWLRWVFLAWAVGLWVFHPLDTREGLLRATMLLFAGYLITATTVHPWYLTWVLVLVPFTGPLRWAWVWASYASFWTYAVYVGWGHGWQMVLVWGGFVVFAVAEEAVSRRGGRGAEIDSG